MHRLALSIGTSLGLAAALASACGPGDERKSGAAGIADAFSEAAVFECDCAAKEAGLGEDFERQCREELGDIEEFFPFQCIDDAIQGNAAAEAAYDCLVDATYDYVDCYMGEGCPQQFSCADGDQIPMDWVCDGGEDCTGGEDEQQDCPAPMMCADGTEIPGDYRCDGFPDCADGEDEPADCPETCETILFGAEERCPAPPASVEAQIESCFPDEDDCTDPELCATAPEGPLHLRANVRARAMRRLFAPTELAPR